MTAQSSSQARPDKPSLITTLVIFSGAILSTLITMAILPAMPAMSRSITQGENGALLAQMITTLPAAIMAFTSPFTGIAVQKLGFRSFLALCFALYALAGVAGMFAPNVESLIASRVLMGLSGSGIAALPFALAGRYDPAVRDRLIGFATAAGGIAGIVGLNAGGYLVDLGGWRLPFLLYGVAIVFLLCTLVDRTVPRKDHTQQPASAAPTSSGSIWPLMPLYALLFILAVGFFAPALAGPFLLEVAGISSAGQQGAYLSTYAFSSILAAPAYGFLSSRIGRYGAAAAAAICLSLGMAVMAAMLSPTAFIIGFALCGVGAGWAAPAVISELMMQASPAILPKAMGLKVTAIFVAQFSTPLLMHPVQVQFGLLGAFFAISLLMLLAALWAISQQRRKAAPMPIAAQ